MAVNFELLRMARQSIGKKHLSKYAFVAAGDPAMGAPPMDPSMGGGGAPPMDPYMGGGGAPPMDPSMGGGGAPPMDPYMGGGGAPPMDPYMGGGGAPPPADPMAAIMPMIQQAVQQAMSANGGGQAQATPSGLRPKIDINVEIVQIKKMLAKIIDSLGIHVPVSDMVVTPEDLNQIAQGGPGYAAATPDQPAGGGGLGQIQPVSPMKAAEAWESGAAFSLPSDYYPAQTAHKSKSVAELATALLMRKSM